MRILALTFLLCLTGLISSAQETEIFLATQSGSPFDANLESDQLYWNYSIGVERYLADKLSIAFSYRKMFNLIGGLADQTLSNSNYNTNYNYYSYSEDVKSFAFDFESKYFFDAPDDGWYISSGISWQHIATDVTVTSLDNNGGFGSPPPINLNQTYSDSYSIYPLSIKLGHRNSSDTFVFDYFFGLSYNMGIGNATHQHEDLFQYDPLKRVTFIFGIKAGVKI